MMHAPSFLSLALTLAIACSGGAWGAASSTGAPADEQPAIEAQAIAVTE